MRELIILGTASQVPTRTRNHNGYFLRWDETGFLFDPGEGTQRQMTFAGVSAGDIHRVCVTHFPSECMDVTCTDTADLGSKPRRRGAVFRRVPPCSGVLRIVI